MKEIEGKVPDKVEIVDQKQVKKQLAIIGSEKLHPGQRCWELQLSDMTIREAKYEKDALDISQHDEKNLIQPVRRKIVVREGCMYAVALNQQNAQKKFLKHFKKR